MECTLARDVSALEDPITVGCECYPDCTDASVCDCALIMHIDPSVSVFPYDEDKTLLYPDNRAVIYECNSSCSCSENCRNRLIQKDLQYPVEVSFIIILLVEQVLNNFDL
jgi:hypothetical protein